MKKDLTTGNVLKTMLLFSGPMILGNLLQQLYNIVDTLIAGRALGADALAAVGSAYSLFTFLTSVFIGLCMGSSAVFSYYYGKKEQESLEKAMNVAFYFTGFITLLLNLFVYFHTKLILRLLQVPDPLMDLMYEYVRIISYGLFFVFLYNYFAFLLRALGNSLTPLLLLGSAALMNIALDLFFVLCLHKGVAGAAWATVLSQVFSGLGLLLYTWNKEPSFRRALCQRRPGQKHFWEILRFSTSTCIQQSVMNFGILMIQGLVNSFGATVMAAFAAAVKIDAFAYMPAQEFANSFSTFLSQNNGAGKTDRIRKGSQTAFWVSTIFCLSVAVVIFISAPALMSFFVSATEIQVIEIGCIYLRIEGSFYFLIGLLFLLYAYYRGLNRPEMSIVLTVISLGSRVLLAYTLSSVPVIGVVGIWCAIPIGWFLADLLGMALLKKLTGISPY